VVLGESRPRMWMYWAYAIVESSNFAVLIEVGAKSVDDPGINAQLLILPYE
jgi:hypothetical protein